MNMLETDIVIKEEVDGAVFGVVDLTTSPDYRWPFRYYVGKITLKDGRVSAPTDGGQRHRTIEEAFDALTGML